MEALLPHTKMEMLHDHVLYYTMTLRYNMLSPALKCQHKGGYAYLG